MALGGDGGAASDVGGDDDVRHFPEAVVFGEGFDDIPVSHWEFLRKCRPYLETDTHIFVHANLEHDVPFDQQLPFTPGAQEIWHPKTPHVRQDHDLRSHCPEISCPRQPGSCHLH